MTRDFNTTRRGFFGLAAAAGALAATGVGAAAPKTVDTKAKIVILGAGAAGTALANRLARRLNGAQITIVDGRKEHWYQPGFSLIAAGLKPAKYSVTQTADWISSGIELKNEYASVIDPEAKTVGLANGETLDYDFLIVATGIELNYEGIEGMSKDLIGTNGIGSIYAGPDYAAKTWQAAGKFADEGGVGLFTRPGTALKCAGAPIKHTFLIDDVARRRGNAGKMDITYFGHNKALFGVPIVSEKIRMVFKDRGISHEYSHVVQAIDPGTKKVTFATPDGDYDRDFDYIHIVPPQRTHKVIRDSGLSIEGTENGQGWVEVDKFSLRHNRFKNVFAVGDAAGVPKGKTAASAKWQVPVVEEQLIADIAGTTSDASYNGYTSCPLITRIGSAMLIEFDYNNDLVPSFPGVIAPLEELWISWLMKEVALKATYNAMIRGDA